MKRSIQSALASMLVVLVALMLWLNWRLRQAEQEQAALHHATLVLAEATADAIDAAITSIDAQLAINSAELAILNQ